MKEQVLNRRSELLLVFEKDYPISRQFRTATFERGTLDDVWVIQRERRKSAAMHGATFPEKLVEKIIENFSKTDDVVYDPFLGTGTTAFVAHKLGRAYMGSEISQEYADIALERLSQVDAMLF